MNFFWDNVFRRRSEKELELLNTLKSNPLFTDLSDSELRFLQTIVHIRHYHAGEPIFRQGDLGIGMYIIQRGRIEIYVNDSRAPLEGAQDIFVTQLIAGDFFGEIALVEESGRRNASAVASEESVIIGFFKPDLAEIIKRSPSSGIKILRRLAEVLGRRLKETTDKVSDLRSALKEMTEPPAV